ncbi:MAG: CAP domain-containing protein [Candidatus Cloacimonetes bacterium]|jgi:uncharacterized protein YkwD|nr:CAP domain-containing protein [Candidatus Cloacimonadota bacterium]
MKLYACVLGLLIASVAASTANAGHGGRGIFRHRGSETTTESLNAPIDDAPVYEREHKLLKALNAMREKYGLKALILDVQLHRTARQHCGWMSRTYKLIHQAGHHAENIAMGQPDVDSVMEAWMNSDGHRANILNPNYTKVGIAAYESEGGAIYWCQQFTN